MTPRPGISRMVAPLLSGDATVEKVLDFWSATLTAKVGISLMAVSPPVLSKVEATELDLVVCASPAQGGVLEAGEGDG